MFGVVVTVIKEKRKERKEKEGEFRSQLSIHSNAMEPFLGLVDIHLPHLVLLRQRGCRTSISPDVYRLRANDPSSGSSVGLRLAVLLLVRYSLGTHFTKGRGLRSWDTNGSLCFDKL